MSGGEALTRSLIREGVEVVFGIPGIHMSGSVVAMRDEPGIRHITTRHENGAAHMPYGYARASGKPVVPVAGVYNAASGLATAYARSTPVFLIAGQISRGQMGKDLGAFHEVFNQVEIVAPVTKWRRQAMRPSEVPAAVSEAFRQMRTGRPRPVYLEMPPEVAVEREEVQLRDPAAGGPRAPGPGDHRRPGPEPGAAARQVLDPPAQGPVDATTRRHDSLLTPKQLHQWASPLFDGGPSNWRPWLACGKLHSASA